MPYAILVLGCSLAITPHALQASLLIPPHAGARAGDLAGGAGASPDDAGSVALTNPAGVVGQLSNETVGALAVLSLTSSYRDSRRGFDQASNENPLILNFWRGLGVSNGWHVGVGLYGSAGSAFNFAADGGQEAPFLGELTVVNVGLFVGRRIANNFRFGVQVAPTIAEQALRLPSLLGEVSFDNIRGIGIVGSVGAVLDATDRLSLGISYRSIGYTRMSGNGRVGEVRQKLMLDLYTPQNVIAAINYQALPELNVLIQSRWTRYEDFEKGGFIFSQDAALNQPYISDARNRFRHWLALEYSGLSNRIIRVGVTREPWMIAGSAMRPNLFDTADTTFTIGYESQYENYNIGFSWGYTSGRHRAVSAARNPDFAGVYDKSVRTGFSVHLTWK